MRSFSRQFLAGRMELKTITCPTRSQSSLRGTDDWARSVHRFGLIFRRYSFNYQLRRIDLT
jgi:hypothetical protein